MDSHRTGSTAQPVSRVHNPARTGLHHSGSQSWTSRIESPNGVMNSAELDEGGDNRKPSEDALPYAVEFHVANLRANLLGTA
ncbi:MAG: hypothetical protein MMC33_009935 [Icmadophila ericetorum]|nr:hypothetical protein [Icmadophila ericetorum]